MTPADANAFYIYLKSIIISVALVCGLGYFQMTVVFDAGTVKAYYFAAPSLMGVVFGVLAARIILLNKKLEWYSIRDPLTNTFNHGYYKRILNEWSLDKATFSLILFDIDDFKEINDKYGHQVGDKTLVRICELVADTKRVYDIFARHGGEEFILLTPRTELSEAADLAIRMCNIISDASMPSGHKLTCSFGVAQFRTESDTPDSLFERSDKALYESKKKGKNCVSLEEPEK